MHEVLGSVPCTTNKTQQKTPNVSEGYHTTLQINNIRHCRKFYWTVLVLVGRNLDKQSLTAECSSYFYHSTTVVTATKTSLLFLLFSCGSKSGPHV
jgi:hypothetical protein